MRVTAVQFRPTLRDPAASIARLEPLVREGARDADLVVLPELATTGYVFDSPEDIAPFAERPRGRTFDLLSPIAREAGCWAVAGFIEQADGALFNSALVVDPSGDLAFTYRKTLLYEADETWATSGDSGYAVFPTRAGTFAVGICMDLNDDLFTSWLRRKRPDAIAFPTNWLDEGSDVRPYWRWRLAGCASALVAANSYGPERSIAFCGRSTVLRAGLVLAEAPREGDALVRATL